MSTGRRAPDGQVNDIDSLGMRNGIPLDYAAVGNVYGA